MMYLVRSGLPPPAEKSSACAVGSIKRDLVLAVGQSLFPEIKGTADTEVLFYLALTFGPEDDPPEDCQVMAAASPGFSPAAGTPGQDSGVRWGDGLTSARILHWARALVQGPRRSRPWWHGQSWPDRIQGLSTMRQPQTARCLTAVAISRTVRRAGPGCCRA
jgi:hypothetical protein